MTARLDIHRTTEQGVDHVPLKAGPNRVKVVSGRQFRLLDPDGKLDAESLRVLQIETDLLIENIPVDGSEEKATLILEGYYKVCSASDRCEVQVAAAEDDKEPLLLADVNSKAIGAQSDGTFVLHDPSFQAPTPPVENTFPVRPVLYGLGGAAVLGLALGGGGGGGGDGAPPVGDIPLTLKTGAFFNNRFPTISGTARPGTAIQLRIDTDGDLRENVTYNTTADAAGNWAVNLQTATPASGVLPPTGLSDSNSLAVTAIHEGAQNSLPLTTMVFDDVLPAAAVIAPAAGDGIITGPEKAAGAVLSGTAEAGGSVEIQLGTTTRTATVGADGKWETTLAPAELPAADGEYTMTVTAIDAAGNRGPASTSKVIVNASGTAAVIAFIGTDDIINAAEAAAPVAVTGTAQAGASVKVTLGGVEQTVTADAGGNWRTAFTVPAGLADGTHNVAVETTNAVGNKASSTRAFVLDRTAPAKAGGISFDDDRNAGDGFSIGYNDSRDGTKVSGQAEAGSKVRVRWGDHVETADVNSNGRWEVSFSPNEMPIPPTGERASVVTVTVEDKAGNTSAPEAVNVTLRGPEATRPPVIDDIATDNRIDATEARSAITVSGMAEPGARVALSAGGVNATAQAGADGRWSTTMDLGSLANGQYSVSAVATVDGRPASTEATRTITVDKTDRTPPTLSTLTVAEGPDITAEEARDGFSVTGTAEPGATVRLTLGEGAGAPTTTATAAAGTGAWTATFSAAQMPAVAAGETVTRTVTAVATDAAGNNSAPQSTQLSFAGAPTPTPAPAINVISADDRINIADAATPILLAGTAEPNATLAISVGGRSFSATAGANGQWELPGFNLSTLADGNHTVSATATAPGRPASTAATRPFSVDKTAPAIRTLNVDDGETITAAEAANGFVASGSTEAGASVLVSFNGHSQTVQANSTGAWSAPFTANQMPALQAGGGGPYTLTATPTDAAGNAGTARSLQLLISGAPRAPDPVDITNISGDGRITATESGSPVPVTGTAEPGASVVLRIGANQVGQVMVGETGAWSTTITLPAPAALPAGTHTLTATATVAPPGGTAVTSTDTQSFTLERPATRDPVTPPPAPIAVDIDPISGATEAASGSIALTGTATAGARVALTLGSSSAEATADASGRWSASIRIPPGMTDGNQTVTAVATVTGGTNPNSATSTESFMLGRASDTTAPPGTPAPGTDTTPPGSGGGSNTPGTGSPADGNASGNGSGGGTGTTTGGGDAGTGGTSSTTGSGTGSSPPGGTSVSGDAAGTGQAPADGAGGSTPPAGTLATPVAPPSAGTDTPGFDTSTTVSDGGTPAAPASSEGAGTPAGSISAIGAAPPPPAVSMKQLGWTELLGDAGSIDVGGSLDGVAADGWQAGSDMGGAGSAISPATASVSQPTSATTTPASTPDASPAPTSAAQAIDTLLGSTQAPWELTTPSL